MLNDAPEVGGWQLFVWSSDVKEDVQVCASGITRDHELTWSLGRFNDALSSHGSVNDGEFLPFVPFLLDIQFVPENIEK